MKKMSLLFILLMLTLCANIYANKNNKNNNNKNNNNKQQQQQNAKPNNNRDNYKHLSNAERITRINKLNAEHKKLSNNQKDKQRETKYATKLSDFCQMS